MGARAVMLAGGYLMLLVFYYLLWVKDYTMKQAHNNSNQTVQFKMFNGTRWVSCTVWEDRLQQRLFWEQWGQISNWTNKKWT